MRFDDTHIIILAAGSGTRFGAPLPKQFCLLEGRPVVMHTIDRMRTNAQGASMSLALSADMLPLWHDLCRIHGFDSPEVCIGGSSRFESTARALASAPSDRRIIMVHDAARPFTTPAMLTALHDCFASGNCQGAIPAIPVTDSLRRYDADGSSEAVDRSAFRSVQTPQAFPADLLREAFDRCSAMSGPYTDDASVMEAAGFTNFVLTPGDVRNIKITNPDDIAIAAIFLRGPFAESSQS